MAARKRMIVPPKTATAKRADRVAVAAAVAAGVAVIVTVRVTTAMAINRRRRAVPTKA